MQASSRAQVRLFKKVVAYQQGTLKGRPPDRVIQIAAHIDPNDAKEFAQTKQTSLPNHVNVKH